MKINVVRDRSGKVVASFENAAAGGASTTATPVLEDGETVEELEVPENYRENLHVLYRK